MPTPSAEDLFALPFAALPDLVRAHARERGEGLAVVSGEARLTYAGLDALADRIAAALQQDGTAPGDAVAVCATSSIPYAALWIGILRAGAVVAPLAPGSTPEALRIMLEDCGARLLFLDAGVAKTLEPVADRLPIRRIAIDGSDAGEPWDGWLAPEDAAPRPVEVGPDDAFNIIYSSGTTGAPKGIVQPQSYRWAQFKRSLYTADAVTVVSTPLYSNTTLVSFLPTLAAGGAVVLMGKFDAGEFLRLSQEHHATHAMLVPVQYRRLMDHAEFDRFDLSSFVMKTCTSAPFAGELKAEVVRRWPGGLVEYYGMTEGGGSCGLEAHLHPDKLHTVGKPLPGHDMRVIDDEGRELAPGEVGEVVGRSPGMMKGYHNQPGKTREAEWFSPAGERFIRTGDVGRFDADGFLTLMDRKKDMIISGGFNVYPSDLEAELAHHPDVKDAAVFGVPSEAWGETPVAAVVLRDGATASADAIKAFANARLGKTQRLSEVRVVDSLPRSPIGKILKRELREAFAAA